MNTEATQEKSNVNSTGERLRSAREKMGLTQQNIAERLCLKLSTVRDLEEDKTPTDLASTFLRGYIRSYARLVHIPEEDLLPMMAKQAPIRAAKVEPMQNFALGKRRKKRDGWLMIFTWLVVFVVVGLTGAWWWQNHKAAQDDLVTLSDQNSSVTDDNSQSIQLEGMSQDASTQPPSSEEGASAQTTPVEPAGNNGTAATPAATAPAASAPVAPAPVASTPAASEQTSQNQSAVVSPSQAPVDNTTGSPLPTGSAGVSEPAVDPKALVMNFTKDCWLEVTDASGKKLFSGMQRSGGKLNLAGTAPYRLKIGAPAAVQIQYQGNPVDLSRFIRTNQVARLTVGAP